MLIISEYIGFRHIIITDVQQVGSQDKSVSQRHWSNAEEYGWMIQYSTHDDAILWHY